VSPPDKEEESGSLHLAKQFGGAAPALRQPQQRFASAGGATRHSLLLLQEGPRVYGLYSQADAPLFERYLPTIDEMERSFTLERPETYPEVRNGLIYDDVHDIFVYLRTISQYGNRPEGYQCQGGDTETWWYRL